MVSHKGLDMKVSAVRLQRRRIDISENLYQLLARECRYPEELGDTLERLLKK